MDEQDHHQAEHDDQAQDQQQPLKIRARRRLIGAAVFAVLAALVLPSVMDKEPPLPPGELDIKLVDRQPQRLKQGVGTATATRKITTQVEDSSGKASSAKAKRQKAQREKTRKAKATKAAPSAQASEAKKVTPLAPKKPTSKSKTPAKLPPKSPAKPKEKPVRAAEILAGAANGKAINTQADESGRYVVYVGSFSNASTVKTLRNKLSALGIGNYQQDAIVNTKKIIRVRAGPFKTRAVAQAALDRMRAVGVGKNALINIKR